MSAALRRLRRVLQPLSWGYGGAVSARNAMFDLGVRRIERLPVPVVSVGNVTVGGTGKTPLVLWLVASAQRAGRRPGVLARGYGRARGAALNDEGTMLAARLPGLLQVQDPDRARGGRRLVELGADWIVMDDGFQHRRLHRDTDLLCLDAAAPFADGRLLPAGDLREAPASLRRAQAVILTRADRLGAEERARVAARVGAALGPGVPVFCAQHAARDVLARPDGAALPLAAVRGRRVVLLCAIGRPESFVETAQGLGAEVVDAVRYRDHHQFTPAELRDAVDRAQRHDATLLLTEKDDARVLDWPAPRWVLRVDLAFLGPAPGAPLLQLEVSA